MGCASSKQRTTSVEDLSQKKNTPVNKNKNGQVPANDAPIVKASAGVTNAAPAKSSTEAIQIPGAQRSFLAPDDIPFIDEDVDDEDIDTSIPSVVVKPDVNKNVVKVSVPAVPEVPTTPPVVEVTPPVETVVKESQAVVSSSDEKTQEIQQQKQENGDQSNTVDSSWDAAMDVLNKELESDVQVTTVSETNASPPDSDAVTSTTAEEQNSEPGNQVSIEQQQSAAIRIQAGIRGYRDRQKVKAIKAARQNTLTDQQDTETGQEPASDTTVEEQPAGAVELEEQPTADVDLSASAPDSSEMNESEDLDDPQKERAATKIQASFKGWKTRKEMGKVKK